MVGQTHLQRIAFDFDHGPDGATAVPVRLVPVGAAAREATQVLAPLGLIVALVVGGEVMQVQDLELDHAVDGSVCGEGEAAVICTPPTHARLVVVAPL